MIDITFKINVTKEQREHSMNAADSSGQMYSSHNSYRDHMLSNLNIVSVLDVAHSTHVCNKSE